jgi:hypothetical protein
MHTGLYTKSLDAFFQRFSDICCCRKDISLSSLNKTLNAVVLILNYYEREKNYYY